MAPAGVSNFESKVLSNASHDRGTWHGDGNAFAKSTGEPRGGVSQQEAEPDLVGRTRRSLVAMKLSPKGSHPRNSHSES